MLHQTTHDIHRGSVIYRSEDQGATWIDCGAPFSNGNALDVQWVFWCSNVINDITATSTLLEDDNESSENKSSAKAPDKVYDLFVASNLGVHVS